MTITFDYGDRELVQQLMMEAGLDADDRAIDSLLNDLEADLQENCYQHEIEYLINEIEETV